MIVLLKEDDDMIWEVESAVNHRGEFVWHQPWPLFAEENDLDICSVRQNSTGSRRWLPRYWLLMTFVEDLL